MRGLVFGLALFVLFAPPSHAALLRCDGCSYAAYEQKALARGRGIHFVYDLINSRVVSFDVEYDRETGQTFISPDYVDPSTVALVNALSAFHKETGGSMIQTIEINGDDLQVNGLGGANAFDVLRDGNLRAGVGDKLMTSFPSQRGSDLIETYSEQLVRGLVAVFGLTEGVVLEVRIHFIDGSSVVFTIDWTANTAEYRQGSARTAQGDQIPESNGAGASGSYGFPGDNVGADRFSNYMRELGALVEAVNGATHFVCSFDGVTVHCRGT
jgi:hypothetical protein